MPTVFNKIFSLIGIMILITSIYVILSGKLFEFPVVKNLLEKHQPVAEETSVRKTTVIYPPPSQTLKSMDPPMEKKDGEMYYWVDENGIKNFSQKPPEGKQLQVVRFNEIKSSPMDYQAADRSDYYYHLENQQQSALNSMYDEREKRRRDREFEYKKKREQVLRERKIAVEDEYKKVLSECSDRYWPDLKAIERCRGQIHERYKKRLEDMDRQIRDIYK